MKTVTLGAASVNQTPMDWAGNEARLKQVIDEARASGVEILCLPELAITGYGCEDMFLAPDTCDQAEKILKKINVAALIADGELLGFYAKQNLAGDGVHYEPRWFSAWPEGEVVTVESCGHEVIMGDTMFEIGGVRIGFEICEDAWVADRPGMRQALFGIDVLLNPSASHFAFGKQMVRERFVIEGSRAFGCAYVYSNLLGNESGRVVFDGGAMIGNRGQLIACESRFSFKDTTLTIASVDVEVNRTVKAATASRDVVVDEWHGLVETDWEYNNSNKLPTPAMERKLWRKEDEFSRVLPLALFDYMRKSFSRGFVLSLSGGADSSAVACLVKIAVDLSISELGEDGVREKLHYLNLPQERKRWMSYLLACVYQASSNSGGETEHAAESLAESVGAEYQRWNISELVSGYTSMISDGVGRQLTWEEDDITLQNIQARVRAPGIWMLTNIRGGLLLATSNRSEAAVGYATMDGDTCGGVSPIAGIDKAFLRHWLKWLENADIPGIEPIPALSAVNALQPTAELRPADQNQTDEDDLMPYTVLDAIEKAAIRDKRKPQDVLDLMIQSHAQYDPEQMKLWVIKFFQLWSKNQWKRERYAPSFHLDDENLDPKTWCRFPILSGGFKEEISQLYIPE